MNNTLVIDDTLKELALRALSNPASIIREKNNRSFYHFLIYFWSQISNDTFKTNWHIELLCNEIQALAERVSENKPKLHDFIANVPPGSTKTIICSIMFPAWCWTRWFWMRFITASYSSSLSLESAEYSRDLIRSEEFNKIYPELDIKQDKDTKSNFKIVKKEYINNEFKIRLGGNRLSTSVGGAAIGFHGHILIWDDPLDPRRAASKVELEKANNWVDQTLSTRKTDRNVTVTIGIMQRLHQNDPTGHLLSKTKKKIRHISLPGLVKGYEAQIQPPEMIEFYTDGLLDPIRMNESILKDLETDLGQYGFSSQIGQHPVPPGGGMFKVDNFQTISHIPPKIEISRIVRYWDKAGTVDGGAYTVGLKMCKTIHDKYVILDVKRGQWSAEERERIIRNCAVNDERDVEVFIEQEPGSGGKESAEGTIRNLAGFSCTAERPTGDKVFRADPFSVQVNNCNVLLAPGEWHHELIEEYRYFPFSTYKDQVDAGSGAFNQLVSKKEAKSW